MADYPSIHLLQSEMSTAESREELVYKTKLAKEAERYEEMVVYIRQVVSLNVELSFEERNLFSMAYKNIIITRRGSWRVLSSIQAPEKEQTLSSERILLLEQYKAKIESEMRAICIEVLSLLEKLIALASTPDAKVFFLKMKGDYFRYISEFAKSGRESAVKQSYEAYQIAYDMAATELSVTHPVRLGLALNFSVFYYEPLNDPAKAIALAKGAFNDALRELETLSEEESRESRLILRYIKDNLSIWNPRLESENR